MILGMYNLSIGGVIPITISGYRLYDKKKFPRRRFIGIADISGSKLTIIGEKKLFHLLVV